MQSLTEKIIGSCYGDGPEKIRHFTANEVQSLAVSDRAFMMSLSEEWL